MDFSAAWGIYAGNNPAKSSERIIRPDRKAPSNTQRSKGQGSHVVENENGPGVRATPVESEEMPSFSALAEPEFVGPGIGNSGFRSAREFADEAFAQYQTFVDQAYVRGQAL